MQQLELTKQARKAAKQKQQAETAAAEELPEEAEPVDETSRASKKAKGNNGKTKDPVAKKLQFTDEEIREMIVELDNDEAPRSPKKPRRVSGKRSLTESESKVFPTRTPKAGQPDKAIPSEEPEAEQPDHEAEQPGYDGDCASSSRRPTIKRQWSPS